MSATYQDLRQQLDELVEKLQDEQLPVDEAAGLYEQALKLIAELQKHLDTAENKITKVTKQHKA